MDNSNTDTRTFLIKVATIVFMIAMWAFINIVIGVVLGWAFFSDTPKIGNYLFYLFFIASTALFIFLLKKRIKK